MRKGMLCLVMFLAMMASTGAWAEPGDWYVRVAGGAGGGADGKLLGQKVETELGYVVSGAVVVAVAEHTHLESEISWRRNSMDATRGSSALLGKSRVTNLAIMSNISQGFHLDGPVTPFVMGGPGVSFFEVKDFGDQQTVFAYQAGAGVMFDMTETLAVEVSYRFFGTTEPTLPLVSDINNTHHNGLVGLTYSF